MMEIVGIKGLSSRNSKTRFRDVARVFTNGSHSQIFMEISSFRTFLLTKEVTRN